MTTSYLIFASVLLMFVIGGNGHAEMCVPWPRDSITFEMNNCGYHSPNNPEDTIGVGQDDDPGFQCGVCGDDLRQNKPRSRETGNHLFSLSGPYRDGSEILARIYVWISHYGSLTFRLCCDSQRETSSDMHIAQGCFNENQLKITRISYTDQPDLVRLVNGDRIDILTNQIQIVIVVMLKLDTKMGCSDARCTLQFNYRTAHRDNETFRTCSNLEILQKRDFNGVLRNKGNGKCLSHSGIENTGLTFSTCNVQDKTLLQLDTTQAWGEFFTSTNTIKFESSGNCISVRQHRTTKFGGIYEDKLLQKRCDDAFEEFWYTSGRIDTTYVQLRSLSMGKCISGFQGCVTLEHCKMDPPSDFQLWIVDRPPLPQPSTGQGCTQENFI